MNYPPYIGSEIPEVLMNYPPYIGSEIPEGLIYIYICIYIHFILNFKFHVFDA